MSGLQDQAISPYSPRLSRTIVPHDSKTSQQTHILYKATKRNHNLQEHTNPQKETNHYQIELYYLEIIITLQA